MENTRVVSLSPKSMVDSKADWTLSRVVDFLQRQEQEDKTAVENMDCRLYHSSSIGPFKDVVAVLADNYGVTRGKMCRWLSYHGDALAKEDSTLMGLVDLSKRIRSIAVEKNSRAISRIQDGPNPYSPKEIDDRKTAVYLYNSWVMADFTDFGEVCGLAPLQVAQVYMLRSALTSDLPILKRVGEGLSVEFSWWGRWLAYRARSVELAVAMWEAGE